MTSLYRGWVEQLLVYLPGGVRLGGFPGENPLLMIGSLFYMGDRCLSNNNVDKSCVEKAYNLAKTAAEKYGIQLGVDLIIPDKEMIEHVLDTIDVLEPPIFLDIPDEDARPQAYRLVGEKGLGQLIVANGIDPYTRMEEINMIRDAGIDTALLLLFDPKNPVSSIKPSLRLKILREVLQPNSMAAGFKNLLVDAIVLDPASIALSGETIYLVKKHTGLPSGCAPANSIGIISRRKHGPQTYYSVNSAVIAYLRTMGADYIMYGPMKRLETLAEAAATIDSLLAYNHLQEGKSIPRSHPLRKYWKNIQRLFATHQ